MKDYDEGHWAVCFAYSVSGSVIPKALVWALPAGICAAALNLANRDFPWTPKTENLETVLQGYSVGLAFLLIFRTQIAYGRLWEGISYLQVIRAAWLNVVSCCFAFCSAKEEKTRDVAIFQNYLARMMSMLYSLTLQSCSRCDGVEFPVINIAGVEKAALDWMMEQENKPEVMVQWIQRLIVEASRNGVIDIPPPILSRVFQGLDQGLKEMSNAHRINLMPFPFPYAQMISVLLQFHIAFTVLVAGLSVANPFGSASLAFMVALTFWSLNYVAIEIEMPYGDDENDLPMVLMQEQMNINIRVLLEPYSMRPPAFEFEGSDGHRAPVAEQKWKIRNSVQSRRSAAIPVMREASAKSEKQIQTKSRVSIEGKGIPDTATNAMRPNVTSPPLQRDLSTFETVETLPLPKMYDSSAELPVEASDLASYGSTLPQASPTKKKGKKLHASLVRKDLDRNPSKASNTSATLEAGKGNGVRGSRAVGSEISDRSPRRPAALSEVSDIRSPRRWGDVTKGSASPAEVQPASSQNRSDASKQWHLTGTTQSLTQSLNDSLLALDAQVGVLASGMKHHNRASLHHAATVSVPNPAEGRANLLEEAA